MNSINYKRIPKFWSVKLYTEKMNTNFYCFLKEILDNFKIIAIKLATNIPSGNY